MVAADLFLVGRYLGHNMWCCSTAQPKFEWDLTLGPFSPNRDWREATGVGEDTICDFPFGCQNCECEPDGTDEAGRISAAGCPDEEPTPRRARPRNQGQSGKAEGGGLRSTAPRPRKRERLIVRVR